VSELNFEPRPLSEYTPENGWHADALAQELPRGSFAVAARLVRDYKMADPALVRADYDPAAPLLGRVMTLHLIFKRLLSVKARVKVTQVWDEPGLFGFEYATLPGHVERGRMDYQVREHPDGRVDFRIHAHSRASHEGPWWVRIGFRLFGRREQLRFYLRCCERIARLTAEALGLPHEPPPPAVRIEEADAPETAELSERLVPRRTRQPSPRRSSSR
jgi:uncharacterized protein (UPF0548 family)